MKRPLPHSLVPALKQCRDEKNKKKRRRRGRRRFLPTTGELADLYKLPIGWLRVSSSFSRSELFDLFILQFFDFFLMQQAAKEKGKSFFTQGVGFMTALQVRRRLKAADMQLASAVAVPSEEQMLATQLGADLRRYVFDVV